MQKLRSQGWFGKNDRDGFSHRSWMKNQGWPRDFFNGRPVMSLGESQLRPTSHAFSQPGQRGCGGIDPW